MSKVYAEVTIHPHHAGFSMWERHPNAPEEYYDDFDDLLAEIRSAVKADGGQLFELGVDELPEEIEDIRGAIYGEPDRVYAIWWEDQDPPGFRFHSLTYFGIDSFTEED